MADDKIAVVNRDIGKAVLEQAHTDYNAERTKAVSNFVKNIIRNREFALYWQDTNRMAAEFFDRKLKAIDAGEFTISPVNGAVTFHDESLRPENYRREDELQEDPVRADRVAFLRKVTGQERQQ
jgi:hypothetical protein